MQPAEAALAASLSADMPLTQAVASAPPSTLFVSDSRGLIGVLTLPGLETETNANPERTLSAIVDPIVFPHVHSDQGLDLALERMGRDQLDVIPVVNRANIHKVEGIVTLKSVLESYGVAQP